MKKNIVFILALMMAFLLCACAEMNNSSTGKTSSGSLKAGEYVTFGKYNWLVLKIKGGDALVISERVLDFRPYNNESHNIKWDNCDIRAYLNGEFYNSFTEDERKLIKSVTLKNPDNPWNFDEQGGNDRTLGCENTKDCIFLLSLDEVNEYFGKDGKKSLLYDTTMGKMETKLYDGYEDNRKAYFLSGDLTYGNVITRSWMTRTPGMYSNCIAFIGTSGAIDVSGSDVSEIHNGMRPAMWLKNANKLKKSVVICTHDDCTACKDELYNEDSTETWCIACGDGGICSDKEKHNRLYHDWKYNYASVTDEDIEQITKCENEYRQVWDELITLLEDAQNTVDSRTGKIRQSRIVSSDVYGGILKINSKETMVSTSYSSLSSELLNSEMEKYKTKTAMLREVKKVVSETINEVNSSALDSDSDIMAFFGATLMEVIRTDIKEAIASNSKELWDSGYYHLLLGDEVLKGVTYEEFLASSENKVDEFFGEDKIIRKLSGGEAILDGYLTAVFLN